MGINSIKIITLSLRILIIINIVSCIASCRFEPEDSSPPSDSTSDTNISTNDEPSDESCSFDEAPTLSVLADASDLRVGKYLWNSDGTSVEGTMTEHGAVRITDASETYVAGHVESISVDAPFDSSICSGTSVLGVSGTATCGAIATPTASTICTGTTILGVDGVAICLGSAGNGTAAAAPQICSGYYAYGSSGSTVNGSGTCNEESTTQYTPPATHRLVWFQADVFKLMNGTNGSTIKSWPDISGNYYTLIDSGDINEPTYFSSGGANNKAYIDFSGTSSDPDGLFSNVAINDTDDVSIFVVAKPDDPETSSVDYLVVHTKTGGGSSTNRSYSLAVINRKLRMAWEYNNGTNEDIDTCTDFIINTSSWALMSVIRDKTNKLVDFRYNNNTETVAYTNHPTDGSSGVLRVGTYTDTSGLFDGAIAEILIYSEKITGSDLTQVNCYLSEKYDLEITGC